MQNLWKIAIKKIILVTMQAYFNPSRPEPGRREKINIWCLKILHKTFWGTTRKKRENENNLS